jgi:tetratricopeptide (TPR) repeat protein
MRTLTICAALLLAVIAASPSSGEVLTLPPDGDNQKASVSQWIGPVEVTITYHSPDVTGPSGEDRRGKIWGQLVPWGMVDLGWGTCGDNCPWRAGANENTVFAVSHDVLVEGQELAAGRYGLHMIPGESEWTIIFSRNTDAWGSFFYDQAQDALRITVKARKHAYTHWLNYAFVDRQPDRTTAALQWDELEIPWTIAVPNVDDLYVSRLREELTGELGFSYLNWVAAARFCVQKKINLEEGLRWAKNAVSFPWVGQEDFSTLQMLSRLQAANGLTTEADATMSRAINHPTASVMQVHTLARQLIAEGRKDKALEIFTTNHERHPDDLTTVFGMARGLSAVGRYDDALEWAQKALQQATAESSKDLANEMIAKLRASKDVN